MRVSTYLILDFHIRRIVRAKKQKEDFPELASLALYYRTVLNLCIGKRVLYAGRVVNKLVFSECRAIR